MKGFHETLLDSISIPMPDEGVALLPFALHDNAPDEKVWGIADLAKQKGFAVDIPEGIQLTPQSSSMSSKRALVHTIRLQRAS